MAPREPFRLLVNPSVTERPERRKCNQRAYIWFRRHIGGATEAGARAAFDLAHAEYEAGRRGWTWNWLPDEECEVDIGYAAWWVELVDEAARQLGAVGGILLPITGDDAVCRQVEAELASAELAAIANAEREDAIASTYLAL